MSILSIAISIFIVLELLNVIVLYFNPDTKKGNGVAVFNSWNDSKKDAEMFLFTKYMVNWVAGSKLIFISLLVVILLIGDETIKFYSICVMIVSIATYFWRLHPIIKELDKMGAITPKGYSKKLGNMIVGFLCLFIVSLIIYKII
ncbi:hypothetical protein QUF55_08860 [Clostridiaceae bacterium HSG29]|nr:hypothetical protein [Clostridiaceae bacterium HSG29]